MDAEHVRKKMAEMNLIKETRRVRSSGYVQTGNKKESSIRPSVHALCNKQ